MCSSDLRNFEKFGANLGQKRIPGGHAENGLVLKGKVSVFNGRPTRTCTFKLTPACLALRVCKMEGGKRYVTYLDAKEISWPKDVGVGPDIINFSGGLAQAQPVVEVSPLKGILVNPVGLKDSFEGQASWAVGESSRKPEEVKWVAGASCGSGEHDGGFRVAGGSSGAGGVLSGVFRRGGDRPEEVY